MIPVGGAVLQQVIAVPGAHVNHTYHLTELLGSVADRPPAQPLADGVFYLDWRPPAVLDRATKSGVYRALLSGASRAFGADLTNYWHDREREGFLDRISRFVMIFDAGEALVGWTSYRLIEQSAGVRCVYVDSTVLQAEQQSRGLMRRLYEALLEAEPAVRSPNVYVTARTESPIFYRLFAGLFGRERVYPQPGVEVPPDVVRCASELAEDLGQRSIFDPPTLRVLGAYGNVEALYGELPTCGQPDLDRFFREHLGPLDAFLLVAVPRASTGVGD
jgi:hypothetical protein